MDLGNSENERKASGSPDLEDMGNRRPKAPNPVISGYVITSDGHTVTRYLDVPLHNHNLNMAAGSAKRDKTCFIVTGRKDVTLHSIF